MELPWRPLYEILDRLYFYSARKVIYIRREYVALPFCLSASKAA
jgi:hypothetical protein